MKCKSPQGGCIRGEVEEECTSSILVGDLQITAQDVAHVWMKRHILDPREQHISDLKSSIELPNEVETRRLPSSAKREGKNEYS